jgi:hypothetical protein
MKPLRKIDGIHAAPALPTANCQLPTANCQLPTANARPTTINASATTTSVLSQEIVVTPIGETPAGISLMTDDNDDASLQDDSFLSMIYLSSILIEKDEQIFWIQDMEHQERGNAGKSDDEGNGF